MLDIGLLQQQLGLSDPAQNKCALLPRRMIQGMPSREHEVVSEGRPVGMATTKRVTSLAGTGTGIRPT